MTVKNIKCIQRELSKNYFFPVKIPITDCSLIEIPVPFQPKLHKQWCLFDQAENIDFDTEVKKIESKRRILEENGQDLPIDDDLDIFNLRSPEKREIDPIFTDFSKIPNVGGNAHQPLKPRYKKKRHTEHAGKTDTTKHVTTNTKIVRRTKHVSQQ